MFGVSIQGVKGALGDPGLPGPTGIRGGFGERVSDQNICLSVFENLFSILNIMHFHFLKTKADMRRCIQRQSIQFGLITDSKEQSSYFNRYLEVLVTSLSSAPATEQSLSVFSGLHSNTHNTLSVSLSLALSRCLSQGPVGAGGPKGDMVRGIYAVDEKVSDVQFCM